MWLQQWYHYYFLAKIFNIHNSMFSKISVDMLKVARLCQLRDVPELKSLCGGKALEMFAQGGDPKKYPSSRSLPGPMFTFTGYENSVKKALKNFRKGKKIFQELQSFRIL